VFEQKAGIFDKRGIVSCCCVDWNSIRYCRTLTRLLFIPEVPGSSIDIETDYHFFCFLTFPPYIKAIIDRFLPHPLQSIVHLRSAFFCDVTQLRLVVNDVSAQPVCSIIKGQAVREDGTDLLSRSVCNKLPVCAV